MGVNDEIILNINRSIVPTSDRTTVALASLLMVTLVPRSPGTVKHLFRLYLSPRPIVSVSEKV